MLEQCWKDLHQGRKQQQRRSEVAKGGRNKTAIGTILRTEASSRGGLSGKAPHCEPPGEMDPSQLGWGQQEPRSRGCCWKLAPRLDPKGALAGKAQMTQTQPLSGRGGSAWAPRTAAVRGPALSAVLKPGVCGRRTGRGRFRRSICAPGAE